MGRPPASCGAATAITAASRRWTGRTSTTTSITSSASPVMWHSMRWWPRPPIICASITPRAARRSCAPSFTYQAGSWTRPRKVVARLECSLQPDAGGTTSNGMRQEVDIRYVVTSLKGSAQHLYENVYCQRGQMENLIKLHKAQLASDRMSCHSAIANQARLVFPPAAYWLMHRVRAAIPPAHPLARAEFATIRERLIKIAARVIEHVARIRIQLPTSCPEGALFRTVALGLMRSGP